jgi:hypothetical protein
MAQVKKKYEVIFTADEVTQILWQYAVDKDLIPPGRGFSNLDFFRANGAFRLTTQTAEPV